MGENMNEIDKMKKAKYYMDLLSDGIDPATNQEINTCTMKNQDIIECLKYISKIIACDIGFIENKKLNKQKGNSFFITEEQRSQLQVSSSALKVSEIANEINRVTEANGTKKLSAANINDWLESIGLLEKSEICSRKVTKKGSSMGITSEYRRSHDGNEYYLNFYKTETQTFIYEHISDIVEFTNIKKQEKKYKMPKIEELSFPNNFSIKQFVEQNRNKCFIISIGSCDAISNTGSFCSILYFNGKYKFFKESNITINSANKCILYGLIKAAQSIKLASDVIILSSTKLGFNTSKSINHDLCLELIDNLQDIGCKVATCVCANKGSELVQFVKMFES